MFQWLTGKKLPSVAEQEWQLAQLEAIKNANHALEAQARALQAKDLELTLANERLQQLERAKSEFISVTAHQLRTPLAAIKWTFHMMGNGEMGAVTEDQKHFLARGYEGAERVITIVNDLLNIDEIATGKGDYRFVASDINEVVDGVIFEFNAAVKEKEISLTVERPRASLPPVELDPIKMSMALENLIDNAIKYTPRAGQVTVTISDDKINSARGAVEIIVADTGIGILEEERPKVFQRFYRSPGAVKAVPDGLGLGLFIAKDIIDRHHGELWFQRRPAGPGTEFHLTIPLRQSAV